MDLVFELDLLPGIQQLGAAAAACSTSDFSHSQNGTEKLVVYKRSVFSLYEARLHNNCSKSKE